MRFAKSSLRRRAAEKSFVIGAEQLHIGEFSTTAEVEPDEHDRPLADAGSQRSPVPATRRARAIAATHVSRAVSVAAVAAVALGGLWLLGAAVLSGNDSRPQSAVEKAGPLAFPRHRSSIVSPSIERADPNGAPAQERQRTKRRVGRSAPESRRRSSMERSPDPEPPPPSPPPVPEPPAPVPAPEIPDALPAIDAPPPSEPSEARPAGALEPKPGVREFGP